MAEFGQRAFKVKVREGKAHKAKIARKASETHMVSAQSSASLCGRSAERERRQGDRNY